MANLAPQGPFRAFDSTGAPLAGGKLYSYEAGTTTPKDTYTDESGDTANANPVILDAEGYANVWLGEGFYKLVLTDANDVEQWTIDDVAGSVSNAFASQVLTVSTNTNITTVYRNVALICTASLTLTLLPAATADNGFFIIVKNASAGDVTIVPNGSETIDGASSLIINPNNSAVIMCDGTAWYSTFLQTVTASNANTFTGTNTFTETVKFDGKLAIEMDGELTIVSGEITVTGANHIVDTEGDAASDDLDTINGGIDGSVLTIAPANDARTVVVKHGTGNIATANGIDVTLDDTDKQCVLIYSAAKSEWVVVASPQTLTAGNGISISNGTTIRQLDNVTASLDISSSAQTSTSTSPADVTGLSQSITPAATSSKIMIRAHCTVHNIACSGTKLHVIRGSTEVATFVVGGENSGGGSSSLHPGSIVYVDSPSTTSSTTYKIKFSRVDGPSNTTGGTTTAASAACAIMAGSYGSRYIVLEEIFS